MTPLIIGILLAFFSVLVAGCCAVLWVRHRKSRSGYTLVLIRCPEFNLLSQSRRLKRLLAALPAILSSSQSNLARVSGLTLREAEDLLDWLEHNGCVERALACEPTGLFAVEIRPAEQTIKLATLHVPHPVSRRTSVG